MNIVRQATKVLSLWPDSVIARRILDYVDSLDSGHAVEEYKLNADMDTLDLEEEIARHGFILVDCYRGECEGVHRRSDEDGNDHHLWCRYPHKTCSCM